MLKQLKNGLMSQIIFSVLFITILVVSANLNAAKITGLQVIKYVYNRSTGDDQTANLTMTLINSRGDERVREIKQYLKEFDNMEKKIMFFISPADVRNTSFMNWSYDEEGRNDDQWIYLPALRRVKRISSDSKSDYFMGSDFTYDDLGDRHPNDDTHTLLRNETVDGVECYVVESVPKEEEYMYSKTKIWVIKDKWIALKKEFYDEDGDLLKILYVKDYQKIKDCLIITFSEMHNVQSDHKTKMILENVKLDTGVSDSKFTERMMKRGI
ncbi:MAG: outer membrane lipoprotein-sorting protein [Candidatus Cloacimonadota bacterium]|nr:outer membrane lipoprotein-sorting protein [Candidatus Cloacimonadota bacterium]